MRPFQQKLNTVFLTVLSLPCTAMGFALSVQIAALSWIMSEKYGLAIHDVGLVWAAGPIAGILGQPIVGLISDKVWFWGGRRKPFIWIGGVLTALALLALPNIDLIASGLGLEGILGVAMMVTLVLDLSINISFNPTRSIIADVTPDDHRRTRAFTWMQAISGSFGVLAYLLGITAGNIALIYVGSGLVLLFSLLPPLLVEEPRHLESASDAAADAASPPASAWQIFGTLRPLAGFLLYAVYHFVREVMHRSGGGEAEHGAAAEPAAAGLSAFGAYGVEIAAVALTAVLLIDTFRRPDAEASGTGAFRKILAAHAFTWLGIQTMFVFMFAWLRQHFPDTDERQLGQQIGWSFFTLNAVAAVLPALVLEPLARSIPRIALHRACIASMALGFVLLLYFGHSPLAIYVLMGLLGVGWASTISLVFAIMSNKARGERMGLFMGLFNLSVVLPQLTVSLGIGRLVSDAPDKDIIFWIAAGALGVSALLWGLIPKGRVCLKLSTT
jgi:maltose/moltooligosaccharide transporter